MTASDPATSRFVYSATVHDEPGERAVVLDREDMVWQRIGPRWYSVQIPLVMLGKPGHEWSELLLKRGPVALIVPGSGNPFPCSATTDHARLRQIAIDAADEAIAKSQAGAGRRRLEPVEET